LEAEDDFSVIGESADGLEVTALVDRLRPDILLLDLMMPGISGLEVTWQVRQSVPETNVIILSMHANEAYVIAALKNGADGYVLKDSSAQDLLQAVRNVSQGRRYLSPPLSQLSLENYMEKARSTPVDVHDLLTAREREVLNLAAASHTSVAIGTILSISPRTAEAHRSNLMRKLGLRSQGELIRYALQRGIISMND
jgi:DNA-binding NarL/FixJ family response regulator